MYHPNYPRQILSRMRSMMTEVVNSSLEQQIMNNNVVDMNKTFIQIRDCGSPGFKHVG